jgi:hypothetical protein
VDVTLHARGEKFLHGEGASASWVTSLTQAVDKIVQQAQRVKGKWQERKRGASRSAAPAPIESREAARVRPAAPPAAAAASGRVRPRMPRILRASRQPLKAMSVGDAARQIEADGEGVVVFRDAETDNVSVLFRGSNGELTLVETEA